MLLLLLFYYYYWFIIVILLLLILLFFIIVVSVIIIIYWLLLLLVFLLLLVLLLFFFLLLCITYIKYITVGIDCCTVAHVVLQESTWPKSDRLSWCIAAASSKVSPKELGVAVVLIWYIWWFETIWDTFLLIWCSIHVWNSNLNLTNIVRGLWNHQTNLFCSFFSQPLSTVSGFAAWRLLVMPQFWMRIIPSGKLT